MNKEPFIASEITSWDDQRWSEFEYWIKNILRTETVRITFLKSDGSERIMLASLEHDKIGHVMSEQPPPVVLTENADGSIADFEITPRRKPPAVKAGTIRVLDTEIKQWRSFKVRNITNIYELLIRYGDAL